MSTILIIIIIINKYKMFEKKKLDGEEEIALL